MIVVKTKPEVEVDLRELLLAFKDILKRADMYTHHQIQKEVLSVRARMSHVLGLISPGMRFFIGAPDVFCSEVSVDLCGRDIGVPQQFLNHPQVSPATQHMSSEAMA